MQSLQMQITLTQYTTPRLLAYLNEIPTAKDRVFVLKMLAERAVEAGIGLRGPEPALSPRPAEPTTARMKTAPKTTPKKVTPKTSSKKPTSRVATTRTAHTPSPSRRRPASGDRKASN